MTVGEIIGEKSLVEKGEKELIISHILRCQQETLIAHPERKISAIELRKYRHLLKRRAEGEPFAYVIGEKWFYGRAFKVTPATLIPRPETETLIDVTLELISPAAIDQQMTTQEVSRRVAPGRGPRSGHRLLAEHLRGGTGDRTRPPTTFVDVGTGSGAIAITLAAEQLGATVIALDTSAAALNIARQNAQRLGAKVQFLKCDITKPGALKKLPKAGRLAIVANLPYLKTGAWKNLDGGIKKFEPKGALLSGQDGLDHYRALMKRLSESSLKPDFLALEADPPQFKALKKIVQAVFPEYQLEIRKDLHGDDRVLIAVC
jgi:release factor glutamine methyltransferase